MRQKDDLFGWARDDEIRVLLIWHENWGVNRTVDIVYWSLRGRMKNELGHGEGSQSNKFQLL